MVNYAVNDVVFLYDCVFNGKYKESYNDFRIFM